jgi:hypothetical protein
MDQSKNTRHTRRTIKPKKYNKTGGTLKKNRIMRSLLEPDPLDMYYPYLEILKTIMKQGYSIEIDEPGSLPKTEICIKGDAAETAVDYGGRGKETVSITFKCNENTNLILKAYINFDFVKTNETYNGYRVRMSNPNIWGPVKEFNNISNFNSPYIIKAYKYFFFDGKNCELSSIVPPKPSSDLTIIEVLGEKAPKITEQAAIAAGWAMKHRGQINSDMIPWFSGIILEQGRYNIYQDLEKHYSKIDDLFNLYKQYLRGIIEFGAKGYIHTNLHWDNLLYNYDELTRKFTAKIIHVHKIYNIEDPNKLTKFIGARIAVTPVQDKQFMISKTAELPNPVKATQLLNDNKQEILKIRYSYDLYGLSKSFQKLLEKIERKIHSSPEIARLNIFKTLLQDATNENFLTRINNDEALQRISELYTIN